MEDINTYWPWLFLLLPVAYLFGWIKGRRHHKSDDDNCTNSLSSDYFRGLNYLLSDQQDKALPVFLRLVQVDNETIDTHLALATIYRRSGNLDRAIEVHQNLIARPSLSANYRSKALLELGRDYLAAGLFDRAEGLFNDVIKSGHNQQEARQFMLTIYQQEKEWSEAIKIAKALIQQGDDNLRPLIAQFYCEVSDQFFSKGNTRQAESSAKEALSYYPVCIRAMIIRIRNAVFLKKYKDAIKTIKLIDQTDLDYFPAILSDCLHSYRELGKLDELVKYLKHVETRRADLHLMETIVNLIVEVEGDEAAFKYLQGQLSKTPDINGLSTYMSLLNKQDSYSESSDIHNIRQILDKMKSNLSQYQCRKCGYTSGTLNWQCPSCNSWGEVKPVTGNIHAKK